MTEKKVGNGVQYLHSNYVDSDLQAPASMYEIYVCVILFTDMLIT